MNNPVAGFSRWLLIWDYHGKFRCCVILKALWTLDTLHFGLGWCLRKIYTSAKSACLHYLKPFFVLSHYWTGIMKPQGSKKLTFWKKTAKVITLYRNLLVSFVRWSVLASFATKWLQSMTKDNFSDLQQHLFQVVMIKDHNKRDILVEFRGGFRLIKNPERWG